MFLDSKRTQIIPDPLPKRANRPTLFPTHLAYRACPILLSKVTIRRSHPKHCSIENTVDALPPVAETVDDHPCLDHQVEDGGADAGKNRIVVEEETPRCDGGKLTVEMRKQFQSLIASENGGGFPNFL